MENIKQTIVDAAKGCLGVLLFMALIQPFGIDQLEGSKRMVFILTETFLAFIATVVTQLLMDCIFRKKDVKFTLRTFLIDIIVRSIIFVPLLSSFLITFCSYFNCGNAIYLWYHDGVVYLGPFLTMCIYVSAVCVFVYIFEYYQSKNDKLRAELEEIKSINALLEERQQKLSEEAEENIDVTDMNEQPLSCTIVGQGQGATLELNPKDIIYVESMANYADICYIKDGETKHTTLRITLKQIKETLSDYDWIVQCHRAFLVNINFVARLSSHSTGYQIQVFGLDKSIPVSRANTDNMKKLLEKK